MARTHLAPVGVELENRRSPTGEILLVLEAIHDYPACWKINARLSGG